MRMQLLNFKMRKTHCPSLRNKQQEKVGKGSCKQLKETSEGQQPNPACGPRLGAISKKTTVKRHFGCKCENFQRDCLIRCMDSSLMYSDVFKSLSITNILRYLWVK